MESILRSVNGNLWGIPVLIMIIIVGVMLTIRSRAAQNRLLPAAFSQ